MTRPNDDANRLSPALIFAGTQLAIVVFAIAPLLVSLFAGHLGGTLGCRVDESGAHPCMLWGFDIGEQLYSAGVFGWLMLASLPAGVVLWVAHILYTLVCLIRWRRRRSAA